MRAVLAKMALDQLVMSPIFLVIFFTAVKLLEGQLHRLHEVLREKYLKTLAAGYLLWPLALIISFRYVPSDLRILYLNCVQARAGCSSLRLPHTSMTCTARPGAPFPAVSWPPRCACMRMCLAL